MEKRIEQEQVQYIVVWLFIDQSHWAVGYLLLLSKHKCVARQYDLHLEIDLFHVFSSPTGTIIFCNWNTKKKMENNNIPNSVSEWLYTENIERNGLKSSNN